MTEEPQAFDQPTQDDLRKIVAFLLHLLMMNYQEREDFFQAAYEEVSDRVLNTAQAAALFGVHEATLKGWIKDGCAIPHQVVGTKRYFSKRAILDWLACFYDPKLDDE